MSIRVLIVDDSAAYRGLLTRLLAQAPGIEVVGEAGDAAEARAAIKRLAPDVLTLDIEMPGMNGLDFLERLMRLHPLPVVMVSALGRQQAEVALQAIALGAVDFVIKPDQADARVLSEFAERLAALLRTAAGVRPPVRPAVLPVAAIAPASCRSGSLIAIGASTGGTEAIRAILAALPAKVPPILIVQHLPERFVAPFAARLDDGSALTVRLAQDGEPLRAGHAYLSPGRRHLAVAQRGDRLVASLVDAPKVNFHRPRSTCCSNRWPASPGRSGWRCC
nr:chemotaxis protein CheB [Chitinimonas koreensis]